MLLPGECVLVNSKTTMRCYFIGSFLSGILIHLRERDIYDNSNVGYNSLVDNKMYTNLPRHTVTNDNDISIEVNNSNKCSNSACECITYSMALTNTI